MKKFQSLGRSLSKAEMRSFIGGRAKVEYVGCSYNESGYLTCDYKITYDNGTTYTSCGQTCLNGDGAACANPA